MVDTELKTKIFYEISEIDELLSKSSILLQKCQVHEPDFIELSAVGSTIHSFYNGLENIFLMIQKNIDKKTSTKERWHSELLLSMFNKNDNREALLRDSLKESLSDYMGFRHFFRHAYGYHLRWDLAKPLFENMQSVWQEVKHDILEFVGAENGKQE